MKTLKKILPFAKPYHHFVPEFMLYTFLSIVFGVLNFPILIKILDLLFSKQTDAVVLLPKPVFSYSLKYFADYFEYLISYISHEHGKFEALVLVSASVGVCLALSNLFKYLSTRVVVRLRLRLLTGLRTKLYDAYLNQSLRFHHNHTTGESMTAISNEISEIEFTLVSSLQVMLREPFVVISYLVILFVMSYQITLFTLFFLPISGFVITSITKKLKQLSYYHQGKFSTLLSFTHESLVGIKQIQSFTSEKILRQKFQDLNNDFASNSKTLYSKRELASPVSEVLGVFSAIILICFGGYLILNGKTSLTGTGFITYLLVYTQMIQPLKNITNLSSTTQRGIIAAEKIFSIIDEPVEIKDKPNAINLQQFNSNIKFNNISFKYNEKYVINEVTLTIPKGKNFALVGASGSGKSTMVDLLCRFYDVSKGSIEIDGHNIKDITLESLRSKIALVSQTAFLFNDTIANNIAFGLNNVSQQQIEEAAKVANAHEFILNTENGYNTMVGEGGVKLSGGQKQRITIARAVLKNAPILVLDEATSALDSESEKLVQIALENLMKNKTSIVIAHRLSTVKNADEIIVMSEGEIIERGNHDELIQHNKVYKKLVDLQEIN